MIDKIDITGNNFKTDETFRKYVEKRIGKLDRYLPHNCKKDVVVKVIITETERAHGEKFEVSVAMDIPGGKVIAAKDDCTNVFAGIDLVEAKLTGQIRRFKLEQTPHLQKKSLRNLFIKRK